MTSYLVKRLAKGVVPATAMMLVVPKRKASATVQTRLSKFRLESWASGVQACKLRQPHMRDCMCI